MNTRGDNVDEEFEGQPDESLLSPEPEVVAPEIELLDENHARGRWALSYFNLDAATGMTRRLGVMYDDSYRRINGQWQIVSTRSTILAEVLGQP